MTLAKQKASSKSFLILFGSTVISCAKWMAVMMTISLLFQRGKEPKRDKRQSDKRSPLPFPVLGGKTWLASLNSLLLWKHLKSRRVPVQVSLACARLSLLREHSLLLCTLPLLSLLSLCLIHILLGAPFMAMMTTTFNGKARYWGLIRVLQEKLIGTFPLAERRTQYFFPSPSSYLLNAWLQLF